MKTFGSTFLVLMLLSHTYLAVCSASMGTMPCAPVTASPATSANSAQTDTRTTDHSTAICHCVNAQINALAFPSLNMPEPSGQLPLISVPALHDSSPRLVDPPPRQSFI